jgi:hypothetical protein
MDDGRLARPHLLRLTPQNRAVEAQSRTRAGACGKPLATGIMVMQTTVLRAFFRHDLQRLSPPGVKGVCRCQTESPGEAVKSDGEPKFPQYEPTRVFGGRAIEWMTEAAERDGEAFAAVRRPERCR